MMKRGIILFVTYSFLLPARLAELILLASRTLRLASRPGWLTNSALASQAAAAIRASAIQLGYAERRVQQLLARRGGNGFTHNVYSSPVLALGPTFGGGDSEMRRRAILRSPN